MARVEPPEASHDRERQDHGQDSAELDGVDRGPGRAGEPVSDEGPVVRSVPRESRDVDGVDQCLTGEELEQSEDRQCGAEEDDPVQEHLQTVPTVMAVVRESQDPEPADDGQDAEHRGVQLLRTDRPEHGRDQGGTVRKGEDPRCEQDRRALLLPAPAGAQGSPEDQKSEAEQHGWRTNAPKSRDHEL